ncbi:PRC-barrel domain protein [Legionella massiliensis]|uniref:PRC-barrel domain protein n=1 Tax=Legionella massiliensis TaxID=1034943 RepID=A0A078L225_9GAMM|nr:PRC-barrel domain-containing protein [Legionella massiliensis]CDZ79241.1 PRC-barrel domain protein [Legionella massiliensis]CEE14979.1 PRC-barrel domain protein [Legionella massiliensis]
MNISNIVKASEITGTKVKNAAGENLGEINEVVVNKSSGKVSYLVLDFGGVLGFGNKFFAIPWNLFAYELNDGSYILNIDKERLKNAPGFDKEHWPNFAQDYVNTVDQYYH